MWRFVISRFLRITIQEESPFRVDKPIGWFTFDLDAVCQFLAIHAFAVCMFDILHNSST